MKNIIILLFFGSFLTVAAQEVTTLASIPTNYGDGMIMSPEGNVLVSGGWNKDNILQITPEGVVTTYVSGLPGPVGMGFDSDGNLYVSNYTGNSISKVTPEGVITEFASGLDGPAGLIVSDNDEIFVTLYGDNFSGNGSTVLKFDLNGNSEDYAFGNGILDAIGVTMDEDQNLIITNLLGGKVIKVDTDQNIETISTVAGARINQIVYSNEHVFIPSPNLRKIYRVNTIDGSVEHFAGSGENGTTDGELLEAQFNWPNSCAINEAGDTLYILEGTLGLIRAIDLSGTLGLNDIEAGSHGFRLEQNIPNPFNDNTSINFSLSNTEKISITIYNTQGRLVDQPVNKVMSPGNHSLSINLDKFSNGLYFYTLEVGKHRVTKKMILVK